MWKIIDEVMPTCFRGPVFLNTVFNLTISTLEAKPGLGAEMESGHGHCSSYPEWVSGASSLENFRNLSLNLCIWHCLQKFIVASVHFRTLLAS